MKEILEKLFTHYALTSDEAYTWLMNITQNEYDIAQLASFLTVFRMRPITSDELLGFRQAFLELCVPFSYEQDSIDIVGTGGDGKNTFNISTISALVVAGAGYKVTKHGSYGVSSNCGSSNVLEYLGYNFTNDSDTLKKHLDQANICFLHAPVFHPAMKAVVPTRKQMKVKTFFNILGPLVNPAQPKYNFFGVFDLSISRLYQNVMQQTDKQFSVIYALDGYDEISLTGDFKLRNNDGEFLLSPKDLGLPTLEQKDLFGGDDVPAAAKIFTNLLKGNGTFAQKNVVYANAGMAIHLMKPHLSIETCIQQAKESLDSKKAFTQFNKIINH